MTKKKIYLMKFDNGKMVIEPYNATGNHRYEPLLDSEFGTVTTTKQHYRVLLMFPRKAGLIAAARHLHSEASRIAVSMINLDIKHNFQ